MIYTHERRFGAHVLIRLPFGIHLKSISVGDFFDLEGFLDNYEKKEDSNLVKTVEESQAPGPDRNPSASGDQ